MTLSPATKVLLLDIEGTTTPIAFVHDRLFGYVRSHLAKYVADHWTDAVMRDVVGQLSAERVADGGSAITSQHSLLQFVSTLMDEDRKSPGLKTLQGLIWESGYQAGELHGEVWDDVPVAMKRWRQDGRRIAIYSSGSELAQRRLFESTAAGDLTPLISAFFDTRVGAKIEAGSYSRIAQALGEEPASIVFVSDVTAELKAARAAGLDTVLALRPGNATQPDADAFRSVNTLAEI